MSGEGGEKAAVTSHSLKVLLVAILGAGGGRLILYLLDYYVPLEYSSSLSKALEIITRQAVMKENHNVNNNNY